MSGVGCQVPGVRRRVSGAECLEDAVGACAETQASRQGFESLVVDAACATPTCSAREPLGVPDHGDDLLRCPQVVGGVFDALTLRLREARGIGIGSRGEDRVE